MFHPDEVDYTGEAVLFSHRQLQQKWIGAQALLHHLYGAMIIRTDSVQLIDKRNLGYMVFVRLPPDGFRLGLHPTHGAKHTDGTIKNAKRSFDLDGKIHMAGGVDKLDLFSVPLTGRHRGSDGNTSLLLIGHPVHHRLSVMDLSNFVGPAGII